MSNAFDFNWAIIGLAVKRINRDDAKLAIRNRNSAVKVSFLINDLQLVEEFGVFAQCVNQRRGNKQLIAFYLISEALCVFVRAVNAERQVGIYCVGIVAFQTVQAITTRRGFNIAFFSKLWLFGNDINGTARLTTTVKC